MSTAVASPNGTAAAAAPAAPDAAALQKQLDDTRAELAETRRAAEFYEQKAKEKPAPAAAANKTEEEDDTDLLEVITTKGTKGLDELLAKRGFVRAADMDRAMDAKVTNVQKSQEMYVQYPDLKDKGSEFFKATADAYGDLVKQGVSPNVAMQLAAERTELKFMREGKIKTPNETKAEKERDRKARISAQRGEGVSRTPAHAEEEDEDLTPLQENVVRSMLVGQPGKDGKPMDFAQASEAYKSRAKSGVAMKGVK